MKEEIIDPDTVLTSYEEGLLKKARRAKKEGKLLSSEELKKELNL